MREAIHADEVFEHFIVSLSGVQKDDGRVVIYAVWGEGVNTLFPDAQQLAAIGKGELSAIGSRDLNRGGTTFQPMS